MVGSVRSVRYFALRSGIGRDVLHLAGGPVEFRDFASTAAINNVGVERIGRDIAILDYAYGMPLAIGDGAVVAAAGDADRAALLLPSANAIGESGCDRDVINLRCGLVVPGTPGRSAVDGDERALVADEKNNVWVVGIDPEILVVVAAGSAAESGPGLAAVGGLHGYSACAINHVCVFGIDSRNGKISATDAAGGARVVCDFGPAFSGVVGAVDTRGRRRLSPSVA